MAASVLGALPVGTQQRGICVCVEPILQMGLRRLGEGGTLLRLTQLGAAW